METLSPTVATLAASLAALALIAPPASAQGLPPPPSLRGIEPPLPDLEGVVTDARWAAVLGKAFFWDTQAGSDGQACAGCHFHAGADFRITNQLNPGTLAVPPDRAFGDPFGLSASVQPAGPNITLEPEDFPLHQLDDPLDRDSVRYHTNDVVSSQGVFAGALVSVRPGLGNAEVCEGYTDDVFQIDGLAVRQVEPRHTPTVINAVFFDRNFWDGRANNVFNGVGVFGPRDVINDPTARVLVWGDGGALALEVFARENSSLASQAVAPPLSAAEMSCEGRTFPDFGRTLLLRRPLADQAVHPTDGVFGEPGPFGDLRDPTGHGLHRRYKYAGLIRRAFDPKYWGADGKYRITPDGLVPDDDAGYTQMELNFALFWGLAIQTYEATLISDDSPFDRFREGDPGALSAEERRGLQVFTSFQAGCAFCHGGPLFSNATAAALGDRAVDRMPMADGGAALYDRAFYNLGVTPVEDDAGVGGTDPYGHPLSFARQYLDLLRGDGAPDELPVDPCGFRVPFPDANGNGCDTQDVPVGGGADLERVAVDGAFKTPSLRNVGLTPPYFHNGGIAELAGVVEFYDRGGNRRDLVD